MYGEAELADIMRVAEFQGISVAEAANKYAWQDDFAILATSIEEEYPTEFTTAKIEDEGAHIASISFRGPAPVAAKIKIAEFHVGRIQILEGRGVSASEIDVRVEAAHRAIAARNDLVDVVTTNYDHVTDSIIVEAHPCPDNGASGQDAKKISSDLLAGLPAELQPMTTVTVDPRVSAGTTSIGGGRMEQIGSDFLYCTGGFIAKTVGGTRGIATAGHCPNSFSYTYCGTCTEWSTSYLYGHEGTWGDFQFSTVSDAELDDFYFDFGLIRDVAAVSNPVQNQNICRFGHTTGAHCSHVYNLSVCSTVGGVTWCKLVRMDNQTSQGGDSGGPWYWGTTAYGIHHGSVTTTFGLDDVWSRVTYLDDALGDTIVTS